MRVTRSTCAGRFGPKPLHRVSLIKGTCIARRSSALPDKIAQDLMQRILTHEFDTSSMLPSERVLQDTYGVSRTVVREALKLLAARGLVTTGTGQGAVVSKNLTAPAIDALVLAFHRSHARLEDLLTTRLLLEP